MLQKMATFFCGDRFTEEWLSSSYLETHTSQKMVIEAKQDEGASCCHKEIHGKGRRGKMLFIKWVIANTSTEEDPIAKARLVAREFNTVRNTWFDGNANCDFPSDDSMCEWGKKSNHAGRRQDSFPVQ